VQEDCKIRCNRVRWTTYVLVSVAALTPCVSYPLRSHGWLLPDNRTALPLDGLPLAQKWHRGDAASYLDIWQHTPTDIHIRHSCVHAQMSMEPRVLQTDWTRCFSKTVDNNHHVAFQDCDYLSCLLGLPVLSVVYCSATGLRHVGLGLYPL
jgi:hypothetical protein